MGNSASNANHPNHNRNQSRNQNQAQSPHRRSRPQSPPSTTNRESSPKPHPSLRTKKKSLELPDLASLALSPTSQSSSSSHPWSRRQSHQTSSPIPIPITPQTQHIPFSNDPPQRGRRRGKRRSHDGGHFDSTQQMSDINDALIEPSTHIPIYSNHEDDGQGRGRGGVKVNPFMRGGPLQYSSTRSFGPGTVANRGWRPTKDPHSKTSMDAGLGPKSGFIPETVHSTIPIALFKAEEEIHNEFDDDDDGDGEEIGTVRKPITEDERDPVPTKIVWQGGGRKVVLARAGDDNWKGRLFMEPEFPPDTLVWHAWIPLLPGTHHIRFIVDDQWRVADSLPTAVDDEGSLSNYVTVPVSGFTPPSSHPSPQAPLTADAKHGQPSFWSLTSSTAEADLENPNSLLHRVSTKRSHPVVPTKWTSEFPPELIAAAAEEEAFLASEASSGGELGVAAPNIPPAPVLPRHLDKLILNERKKEEKGSGSSAGGRSAAREKEREERRQSRKHRSLLGMTSATPTSMNPNPNPTPNPNLNPSPPLPVGAPSPSFSMPVVTPSGTEKKKAAIAFGSGLSDDSSVLPVPSHVVLHHLSTSAIRNGVLAVGNTTRYRKKYLTTIYYKPT